MAITREEGLRQLIKLLKEISAKVGRGGGVVVGSRQASVNLSSVTTALNNVLAELQSQTTLLATTGGDTITQLLTSLETISISMNSNLIDLEGLLAETGGDNITELLTSIETVVISLNSQLIAVNSELDAHTAIDYFLSGDTTDGGDLLNELQSIDQNWNILSLNQLNLAAILAAVLNNATSGRQNTAQTSFDAMVIDLAEIEAAVENSERLPMEEGSDLVTHSAVITGAGAMSASGTLDRYTENAVPSGLPSFEVTVPASEEFQLVFATLTLSSQGGGGVLCDLDILTAAGTVVTNSPLISQSLSGGSQNTTQEFSNATDAIKQQYVLIFRKWLPPGTRFRIKATTELDANSTFDLEIWVNRRAAP